MTFGDDVNGSREAVHDLELWLVHAIQQLPGVLAAGIWLNDLKVLRAAHITIAQGASATIIANATARVLRKHGLEFVPQAIRVMTRDAEGQETEAPTTSPRGTGPAPSPTGVRFLLLHDLSIARSGSRITCNVKVERGTAVFQGEAIELDTESGRTRAAARATLTAAESAAEKLALGLEGTQLLDMFGRKYVAASVEAAIDRRFALLAGLVPVDPARSVEEAACLAALRAIDRWIAW